MFAAPRHPYTRALLSAIPLPDPAVKRARLILQGDVPSAIAPPPGCRFQTRCPYVQARCRSEEPPLNGDANHPVACHFWPEIEAQNPIPAAEAVPANVRIARLQAYFRAA